MQVIENTGKKMGIWSIFFLGVNTIIGSGIFLIPNQAYGQIGDASLVDILLNAVLALSLALCFAEAASRFEKNGSAFIYAKEAFGNFMGFEVGIFTWFICVVTFAAEIQGVLTILGGLFPLIANPWVNKLCVVLIVTILGAINYLGTKASKNLNNVITVSKLVPLIIFIVVGIFFVEMKNFEGIIPSIKEGLTGGKFGSTTLMIFFAFTGFDLIAVSAENMENPKKNLPRGIISVIAFCSVFYFLIMFINIGILGDKLEASNAPIADAMATFFGHRGFQFVTLASLISITGITIALSFIAPISAESLADNGYLPKIFAEKSKFGTPGNSILITSVLVILTAFSGNFIFLAELAVLARLVEYVPTAVAVLVMRKKSNKKAEFTIPLGPVVPVFATIVSLWLISRAPTKNLIISGVGVLIAYIFYLVRKKSFEELEKSKSEK